MIKLILIESENNITSYFHYHRAKFSYQIRSTSNPQEAVEWIEKDPQQMLLIELEYFYTLSNQVTEGFINQRVPIGILFLSKDPSSFLDPLEVLNLGGHGWAHLALPFYEMDLAINRIQKEAQLLKTEKRVVNWIDFNLASDQSILGSVNKFINYLLCYTLIENRGAEKFGFAINELLLNALEHGNEYNEKKRIKVSYVGFSDKIIIKIEDEGSGFLAKDVFDPLKDPLKVALQRKNEGKRPGGYGIAITRQYVDQMERNDKGNVLLLTKNISG